MIYYTTIPEGLHLKSTIGEIPLYEASVEINSTLVEALVLFKNDPTNPGIIITDNNKIVGIFYRKHFFESLSKPYYNELFSNKPIKFFYENFEQNGLLILPSTMSIVESVQKALERPKEFFDAPIIVEFESGNKKILDSYSLMLAQSFINTIALKQLKEANDLKSDLLSVAAHDLKNPLNTIINLSNVMRKELENGNTLDLFEMINNIGDISEHMLKLIIELLNSNVIESGNIKIRKQLTDIFELVNVVVYMNKTLADKKCQVINLLADRNEEYIVNADALKIRESLENLVSNAIKYSPFNSYIDVIIIKINNYIRIEVKDQGPGLLPDDKDKLFGKFQRLSAQPTGNESSTGLGLYIAKQIIELHDGKIWAESEYGKGSSFFIELPEEQLD